MRNGKILYYLLAKVIYKIMYFMSHSKLVEFQFETSWCFAKINILKLFIACEQHIFL